MEATVTISREALLNLIARCNMLEALERNGVENWSGYEETIEEVLPSMGNPETQIEQLAL